MKVSFGNAFYFDRWSQKAPTTHRHAGLVLDPNVQLRFVRRHLTDEPPPRLPSAGWEIERSTLLSGLLDLCARHYHSGICCQNSTDRQHRGLRHTAVDTMGSVLCIVRTLFSFCPPPICYPTLPENRGAGCWLESDVSNNPRDNASLPMGHRKQVVIRLHTFPCPTQLKTLLSAFPGSWSSSALKQRFACWNMIVNTVKK